MQPGPGPQNLSPLDNFQTQEPTSTQCPWDTSHREGAKPLLSSPLAEISPSSSAQFYQTLSMQPAPVLLTSLHAGMDNLLI